MDFFENVKCNGTNVKEKQQKTNEKYTIAI